MRSHNHRLFLSTLSLRRATLQRNHGKHLTLISIHALLAESDKQAKALKVSALCISIHALLAESDLATRQPYYVCGISIHALLAESDCSARFGFCRPRYFYPRSPCGERPDDTDNAAREEEFLSTLSLRRATFSLPETPTLVVLFLSTLSLRRATQSSAKSTPEEAFLSTLSLRRATGTLSDTSDVTANFYPRSPCGERPMGRHEKFV